RFTLDEIDYRTGGPARYVHVRETGGRLGFITPLTHNFCESCNRVRITCTGTLYMCLGQEDAAEGIGGGDGDGVHGVAGVGGDIVWGVAGVGREGERAALGGVGRQRALRGGGGV